MRRSSQAALRPENIMTPSIEITMMERNLRFERRMVRIISLTYGLRFLTIRFPRSVLDDR